MKTLKKYVLGAALVSVAALTGCKDKMVELNTNPAIIGTADVKDMFLASTRFFLYQDRETPGNRAGSIGRLMQYYGPGTIYGTDVENMTNPWPGDWWSNQLYGSWPGDIAAGGPQLVNLIKTIDTDYADDLGQEQYSEIRAIAKMLLIYHVWTNLDAMGTVVYTEGFKENEGIMTPKYDMYEDVYKQLINEVKTEVIDVLKQPAGGWRVSLGLSDSFYGQRLVVTPGQRGATTAPNSADQQREYWLRFANTFRLKMGHRVWNVDRPTFEAVLADYMTAAAADQVMTSNDHNCNMLYGWMDETYNNMDGSAFLRETQRATVGFVNTLRVLDDPRLHLLVRPNIMMDTTLVHSTDVTSHGGQLITAHSNKQLTDYAPFFRFMWIHFPDSLARFGDMMKIGNVYQGASINPFANDKTYNAVYSLPNSGKLPYANSQAFSVSNPNGNTAWTSPSPNNVNGEVTFKAGEEGRNVAIWIPSLMQIRYFYRLGGNQAHYLDPPQPRTGVNNNIDQEIRRTVRNTVPLMSYSEHCFRMAMITMDGFTTGKTDQEWFEAGIEANIKQLYLDALRVWVPIVWSDQYPLIRYYKFTSGAYEPTLTEVNGPIQFTDATGNVTVTPYKIDQAMIDAYIARVGAVDREKLGVQAWIGMYQQPEEAWAFWKQTGFPRMQEIPAFSTGSKNVTLPTTPGMEKAYDNRGAQLMKVQRIATPPRPNILNSANYEAMQAAFATSSWFGGVSYLDKTGRAWWDQNNPPYTVD